LTKIVNFYGGPGTGKSIAAVDTFSLMKKRGFSAELVTEYAKDMVWSDRTAMFEYQEYIFAKQRHRIERLKGKVDYVITDSPINLGHFYMPEGSPYEQLGAFIDSCFDTYDNLNIFLMRPHDRPYEQYGRYQTEEEAEEIDKNILNFLTNKEIPFTLIMADDGVPENVIKLLSE